MDKESMTSDSSVPGSALTGQQRKYLRGLAHPLKPIVHVGEAGVSGAVLKATDEALAQHELIKVRLHAPQDKKLTAAELASATASHLCGLVGHTVILYRRHPEKPKIELSGQS
jgi:RNA-binding protein